MKNVELEKMKIEIKLLKKNLKKETTINEQHKNEIKLLTRNVKEFIEYKEKYDVVIEEIKILKNKNTKLKLEKNTIITDYINLSKITVENATDLNMKLVQNTTDINMKLVQNSADIYEESESADKKPKNKIIKKKEVYEESEYDSSSSSDEELKLKKIIKKK
jgi:hypothetical protein